MKNTEATIPNEKRNPQIGIIFSTFDSFHSGHKKMLKEAKQKCDFLICGLKTHSVIDCSEKNKPSQTVVQRYTQLKQCGFVDEVVPYTTEQDLEDILKSFKIDVYFLGDQNVDKDFTGRVFCEEKGIEIVF